MHLFSAARPQVVIITALTSGVEADVHGTKQINEVSLSPEQHSNKSAGPISEAQS